MVLYFLSPTVAVQTVMTAATIFRVRMSFFIAAPRIRKKNSFVQKCFQILFNSKYCNSIHAVFQKYIREVRYLHLQKIVLVTNPKFLSV